MSHSHGSSAKNVLLEERVETPLFQFRGRHAGTLTLTSDGLSFAPDRGEVLQVPLEEIEWVDEGPRRPFPSPGARTLRITYAQNIVFAVHVEDPQQWMEAINTLSPQEVLQPPIDPVTGKEPRSFRVIIVLMLLLVILATVAVPLFLSWTQTRQNQPLEPPLPQTQLGASW